MNTLTYLATLASLIILLAPPKSTADFTIVMPDSSTLLNNPQTIFSNQARTDPAEQQAVYDIMEATGNGWAKSIPDVCRGRWHGIECMPDCNHIYHIVSLSFGALSDDTAFPTCDAKTSTLSPSLLRLPHLRTLFFYRCLTSNPQPLPAFLGQLSPGIRTLVLRENGHVGRIPSELGNLTSLKILDLHGNNLGSTIPKSIKQLSSLQLLDLSNNQLTGEIPEMSFSGLTALDLSHNLFQGQIPSSISKCESLVKLDMSRNHLTGSIPENLSNLKNLILLDLSHNWLSGPLPNSFGSLSSLRALVLTGNSMNSTLIPKDWFLGLKDLETLVLSNMGLGGAIPESMGRLKSIRVLHLDGNELNGYIPQSFINLNMLSELRMNDNRLKGPIPFRREMLWRMGRKLRLYNNSGLCYDVNGGREHEGVDSLFGISYCGATTSGGGEGVKDKDALSAGKSGQKARHLWMSGVAAADGEQRSHDSSSSAPAHNYFVQMFVLMCGLQLSVFSLFQSFS
ncbi:LOW QUALITY PROTEIN: protein TOO MANY MOUTHS-like [Dioscorea cayenensis subsp. rotundata]|uniref:LOW QUALITY PROTEIN: protein TOO MANY MOUTHS-like n=1 Tax=Dioscorea cayennensis subsp. rotundata TaxID=55577 RepID=A0AB40B395_DIOCR|nr:LOW QUALITY PROTEIN: protein TOO MANY MOUTHS-like [Dioscorea cayenensis subsp. rotundata]